MDERFDKLDSELSGMRGQLDRIEQAVNGSIDNA
jgi:hypothetical protein